MKSPAKLRAESFALLASAKRAVAAGVKRNLARRAFELAQQSEVLERWSKNPESIPRDVARYKRLLARQPFSRENKIVKEMVEEGERRLDIGSGACQQALSERNIDILVEQFYNVTDKEKRDSLKTILCKEENRFAAQCWHVDLADRHIKQSADRIGRQLFLINGLEERGSDVTQARILFENMIIAHNLFVEFRSAVTAALKETSEWVDRV